MLRFWRLGSCAVARKGTLANFLEWIACLGSMETGLRCRKADMNVSQEAGLSSNGQKYSNPSFYRNVHGALEVKVGNDIRHHC